MTHRTPEGRPLFALVDLMPSKVQDRTKKEWRQYFDIVPSRLDNDPRHSTRQLRESIDLSEAIRRKKVDGVIFTGFNAEKNPRAPGLLPINDIRFASQLREGIKLAEAETKAVLLVCLAAQFALCDAAGEELRIQRDPKLHGVFETTNRGPHRLLAGLGAAMLAPHSRHGDVPEDRWPEDIQILSASPEAGVALAASKDGRKVYQNVHLEYGSSENLWAEARRDDGPDPHFPPGVNPMEHSWAPYAETVYGNVNDVAA